MLTFSRMDWSLLQNEVVSSLAEIKNPLTVEKAKAGWNLFCSCYFSICPYFLFYLPRTLLHFSI